MSWFRKEPRIEDVVARLAAIERSQRDLVLDWEQTFEKFRMLYMRLNKRVQREAPPAEAPPSPDGMDPVSAAIIRERGSQ
jgi:hypothetical protein